MVVVVVVLGVVRLKLDVQGQGGGKILDIDGRREVGGVICVSSLTILFLPFYSCVHILHNFLYVRLYMHVILSIIATILVIIFWNFTIS